MLQRALLQGFDPGRLKALLALFFLALAVPTGVLIWQAYSQLKWEAFHQHRILAEDLTRRINARMVDLIASADSRSYADYSFLNVSGDTRYNFVQRSPLAAYPVAADIPGAIGHFQVDSIGAFSTPLLPTAGTDAEQLGIGIAEYQNRQRLALDIQAILADNQLVRASTEDLLRGIYLDATLEADRIAESGDRPGIDESLEKSKERERVEAMAFRASASHSPSAEPALEPTPGAIQAPAGSASDDSLYSNMAIDSGEDKNSADETGTRQAGNAGGKDGFYNPQVFDQLNQPRATTSSDAGSVSGESFADQPVAAEFDDERSNAIGRVSELKLDADLQQKSETLELAAEEQRLDRADAAAPGRSKRREQSTLPEAAAPLDREAIANVSGPTDLRINTFESEIDPFQFSQLGSGHFVLFRNVWREGERYVQGLLLNQQAFIAGAIQRAFDDSTLSSMSNLIVGYDDNVIGVYSGMMNSSVYPNSAGAMPGALLYSSRLTAPLDNIELVFSINRLPPGPGAAVLGWVTLVLAIVFIAGFATMYRLGLSQINLARQQQDFVSAVSHELKTPLTSIRMYGEMLKEGWADEDRRQDYYEYIHDESERLTRMITNVLQLAKITRNEPNFDMQPTSVSELLGNIESKISSQVQRAGFALKFSRNDAADAAYVNIDQDCFTQIIINLVDNAIKFSRNAGEKTIEITSKLSSDQQVQFTIRDHGPGIPKDQIKKIFKLFYRTESELTRETVGTGIGLAIVHQLTVAMHGQVDVINRDPGAEFTLAFPAMQIARK